MKTITLLLLLIAFSFSVQSQSQSIGVSGGLSVSNFLYEKAVDNPAEWRVGQVYKINYEIDIFDGVFLSTGIVYQEKGFTNTIYQTPPSSYIKANHTHRYVGIPIGLGFRAGHEIYGEFILNAVVSTLIDHQSYNELFADYSKYEENRYHNTEDYTPFDIAIAPTGRIGYLFKNRLSLFIEGSFALSLNDFFNIPAKPFTKNKVKNIAFGACIGVEFRI